MSAYVRGTITQRKIVARWTNRLVVNAVLIIFLVISIFPIGWMIVAALRDPSQLSPSPFAIPRHLTLANFTQAWNVGRLHRYFLNSVLVAIPRVLGVVLLSSLAGFAFAKLKFKGREILFYFFLFGLMVPIQAMIIPLYFDVQRFGLIDTYGSIIIPYFGLDMPFAIFMTRAFFREIPDDLLESAKIDGCNVFQAFVRIFVPMILPAISSLIVFEFMWSWNDFLLPLLFVYSDSLRTLPLGLMYFFGEYSSNQTLIAAAVTITIIPIVVVYLIFQRKFVEGLTAGSLKG